MAKTARKKITASKTSGFKKLLSSNRTVLFVAIFAFVGASFLLFVNAQQRPFVLKRFQNNPGRGVSWTGLREPGPGSKCPVELLEALDNSGAVRGCTHGPDPAPEGVDAIKSVEPVAAGDVSAVAESSGAVVCEGDGISGNRVQMIYARATDKPDRFDQFNASFQLWATNMNNIFVESGLQTGQAKSIRFVHDASCNITIARVTLSTIGDDSIGNLAKELSEKGYTGTNRKFITWLDATPFCGMGYVLADDRPTADNKHNFGNPTGPAYGAVGSGCWGRMTEVHELVHTLGGVQRSAPHATSAYHCNDEYDRLCYNDGGVSLTYNCPSSDENRLDCGKDDYFNTNPPVNTYLATRWNVANSLFIFNGGSSSSGGTATPPPSPPQTDTTTPVATIGTPTDGAIIGSRVTISASATDNVGVTKIEIYIDGTLRASADSSSISTSWNSRRASAGAHSILVKAYDAAGNVGQRTIFVYKN